MSMKVERSTVDQVKARFSLNKKKVEEKKKDYDLEQRVAELREEVFFNLPFYPLFSLPIDFHTPRFFHYDCF